MDNIIVNRRSYLLFSCDCKSNSAVYLVLSRILEICFLFSSTPKAKKKYNLLSTTTVK